MAVEPKDVLNVATAMMPTLLAKALPHGTFRFGGEFASPHPQASAKRQRDYRADIVVRSDGTWADNLASVRGNNIISLLAHVQNKSVGAVGAELARTLNPMDALNGHPIRPGLSIRTKRDDARSAPDDGDDSDGLRALLSKVDAVQRSEGISKADALYRVALQQRKRRKW